MSTQNGSSDAPPEPGSPEAIEADIERQREQLAETVDQLQAKLDVKARAQGKVAELRGRATTADGKPRPDLLGAAVVALLALGGLVYLRRRDS
ncbi:DUF3618 domain-containing protein [Nocardioides pantholopis]|uniref:DUF3618 domain-containing protein n=1 Tax=Nocardioides pantholopis TaxID=2483798 RepID=UPI0019D0E02E|nr:DUF3618 domain-containing protein [Nocardioides pantholopis]